MKTFIRIECAYLKLLHLLHNIFNGQPFSIFSLPNKTIFGRGIYELTSLIFIIHRVNLSFGPPGHNNRPVGNINPFGVFTNSPLYKHLAYYPSPILFFLL